MSINYQDRIPNNVDLGSNRTLQRALEHWQPEFLKWWQDLGPRDFQVANVYLRTATSVDAKGWATYGFVHMPDYRWGIFLADRDPERRIGFGDNYGQEVWQQIPGEFRAILRRLIVTQGDTEPASVEQQRMLGHTAPSLYDLRNLFQVNVEEGRHLWAMVYLLHAYFGRDGREQAAHPRHLQRADQRLAELLHVHLLHRSRWQIPVEVAGRVELRSVGPHLLVHADRRSAPHVRGRYRHQPRGETDAGSDEGVRHRRSAGGPQRRRDRSAHGAEISELLVQFVARPVRVGDFLECGLVFCKWP